MAKYYIYIALFGGVGALCRYEVGQLMGPSACPFNTLLVNIAGCFMLAFIIKYVSRLPGISKSLSTGMGTGLIGSFTTFSAFSVETVNMLQNDMFISALLYVAASFILGFAAAILGGYVSIKLEKRRLRDND